MKDLIARCVRHAPGAVRHQPRPEIGKVGLAEMRHPSLTLHAGTTRRDPTERHMITNREAGHVRPHFAHDTGAFVPKHGRQVDRRVASDTVPVAVTDPRGLHLDQDFTGARRGELKRLDHERAVDSAKDGGIDLHGDGV